MSLVVKVITFLLVGGSAFAQEAVPGEYLIKIKGRAASSTTSGALQKIAMKANLKSSFGGLNIHHVALKAGIDAKAYIEELKNDPSVEYVEPNYIIRKMEVANEPVMAQSNDQAKEELQAQGSYTPGSYRQSGSPINMNEMWSYAAADQDQVDRPIVAVIDSGIDLSHDVFAPGSSAEAIWINEGEVPGNGLDDDGNGYIDDVNGYDFLLNTGSLTDADMHGTHVAGIVVGSSIDIFERPLKRSRIRVMPLKFLGEDGAGSTSTAIRAINYAVNNGARVMNNSWGGTSYSAALHESLTYAYNNGLMIVTAAGNYGKNNDQTPIYPANLNIPSNVAVGASNDWDYLASFSNYGPQSVAIAAPGVSIKSTLPGNLIGYMSGTSMAAPLVAGIAAMALREAPDLTGYQLKEAMLKSGAAIEFLAGKISTGKRIDPKAMVMETNANASTAAFQPNYVPTYLQEERVVAQEAKESPSGGCGLVAEVAKNGPGRGKGGEIPNVGLLIGLLALPLIVMQVLRRRLVQNRRYERFSMNSQIKLKVGDRELVGNMNTISEGGLSFSADTMLEKGGMITMQISSPDGNQKIEVQGRVVWNEENKAFGVQFDQAQTEIRGWTKGLNKA